MLNKRYRKRIAVFLLVPLLVAAIIISEELYVQIPIGVLLTVYVGFIIFLRDSLKHPHVDPVDVKIAMEQTETDSPKPAEEGKFNFDDGEGFEILDKSKTESSEEFFEGTEITSKTIAEYNKIISDKIAKSGSNEFNEILRQILRVIRESLTSHSATFFIFDPEKEKISLFAAESASDSANIVERKFPLEQDIVSHIALKKEPAILSNITSNIESDNIRYYSTPQGIKSFCGVPYDYNGQLTFILAVDSKNFNEFGHETIYLLGRYIRLIAVLTSLFEENHGKKINENRLNALLTLISIEKPFDAVGDLVSFFAKISEQMLQWDFLTFISYKASEKKFVVTKTKNKNIPAKYIGEGYEIEKDKSAAGEAIKKGNIVYLRDVTVKNAHRFNSQENIKTEGSFLAVPIIFDGQNFGVITFESLKKNAYSKNDIAFIKKAVKLFSFYIYSFTSRAHLQSLISLDPTTLTLNEREFKMRAEEMLKIEKACEKYGVICLIEVDSPDEEQSLFQDKFFPKALKSIALYIQEELKPNSIIGKLKGRKFAVYCFNQNLNDAAIWAEKVRKKIAQSGYPGLSEQIRYTVSIGIATTRSGETLDKILYVANLALDKSIKSGGNKVTRGN